MNNLFYMLEDLIRHGKTDGLRIKIEAFFKIGTLTEDEYKKLVDSLPAE